jgi:endonuclease/exonuclease/phosphatase (EEP) superfamily protein YafD
MYWLIVLLYLLGFLAIAATLLPMWHTTRWWVRVCDFPRFQVAMLALAILIALPLLRLPQGAAEWMFLLALAGAFLWQMTWIWRYLPGAPREVKTGKAQPGAPERIALLTTNVLVPSRGADQLLDIIVAADPDLILAVETDEWWCGRLSDGLQSRYPHSIRHPLSNGYGLALFSRLELVDPEIRFVVDEAIPSIRTGVRLRCGAVIDVYGVHPRPPGVMQDSIERDLELVRVGSEIKQTGRPAIVLGDLNDVAWSPTTQEFMAAGALRDPRRGRGFFNTYPAKWPGFRYPLDYVFSTSHFEVCGMRVLPRFSSDHLPLIASLCLKPGGS